MNPGALGHGSHLLQNVQPLSVILVVPRHINSTLLEALSLSYRPLDARESATDITGKNHDLRRSPRDAP
jgi:hypothetical protein